MRSALSVLLWLAVACSLSVYAYRIWRRVSRGPRPAEADGTPMAAPTLATATPTAAVPSPAPTSSSTPGPPPPAGRVPVAELVAGIQMPCDLAPLLAAGGRADPFHVSFSTTGAGAGEIVEALTDELERLGFDVARVLDTKLAANKDGRELSVTIVPDAAEVADGKHRRYPTAPPGSVVVELRA